MPSAPGEYRSHTRVDGPAKVTGTALYAADHALPHLAHAAAVTSTVARGRILRFDCERARRVHGLLQIFTYQNLGHLIEPVKHLMAGGYVNSFLLPLSSPEVHYAGQIIALVVAESEVAATEAAQLIHVDYQQQDASGLLDSPSTTVQSLASLRPGYHDPVHGDAQAAFDSAAVRLDETYRTPIQHHNPIELFGTTCHWTGDLLTVFEATRFVDAAQHGLAAQLRMNPAQIRIICPFIGGHFGSRLALSQYTAPVALAARFVGRPVRYVASRPECFTIANHRADTRHRIRIGATAAGEFTAFLHDAATTTSRFDSFAMEGTDVTSKLYGWRSVAATETVVRVDRNTPGPMRAPAEVPYLFALESAVDEIATRLQLDPIELRRRNDTVTDPISGKLFSPRPLLRCFEAGAAAFGWASRNPQPGSMHGGDWLVGFGCASAARPMKRAPASIRVVLSAAGHVIVETAHHEIGNGLYTILAVAAAEHLGTSVSAVTVRLGDTNLPPANLSGGSSTTTSLMPVLASACEQLRDRLARAAIAADLAFSGCSVQDLQFKGGGVADANGRSMSLPDVFTHMRATQVEAFAEAAPGGAGAEALGKLHEGKLALSGEEKFLRWAYGAQFAEVHVHSETGEIRVARLLGAFSAGHIVNRLTALSQLCGGMFWGIGSALLEESVIEPRTTRYVNDNLSEYLIATAADSCAVDAILLDADADPSELMGLGELGIIGVNAAIANAIYHATGRRLRSLPIRVNDLLG